LDALTGAQLKAWERDGFFIVPGWSEPDVLRRMEERIVAMCRAEAAGESIGGAYVTIEEKIASAAQHPEERLAKLFRVHREQDVFREFVSEERLLDLVEGLLGPDLDCFLSQFIAKRPGALGQPWHQDAFYFPFDRGPQVGLWLAVSEARLDNGPLWVVPGSHREAVHPVVGDRRPHASYGYVEIVDHDFAGEVPVLMQPGDLLVFHSHLMHRSTDNDSQAPRYAMVYHLAEGGTIDQSKERWGFTPPNTDWLPVRRSGRPVGESR